MTYRIEDEFIPHRYKMLRSPAWKKLSATARLVLLCLETEYAENHGYKNGEIICTYRQLKVFCETGAEPIHDALNELEALGFIKIKRGRSGSKGYGVAHRFTLNHLVTVRADKIIPPTDEWAKLSTTRRVVSAKSRAKKHGKRPPPRVLNREHDPRVLTREHVAATSNLKLNEKTL